MMIDLPYVQPRKGRYRYRRKVRPDLRPIVGKTEIIMPLGKTHAEVMRRYDAVHAQAERQLAAAERALTKSPAGITELEVFSEAAKQVRKWGFDPRWNVEDLDPEDDDDFDDAELVARTQRVEAIAKKYPQDERGRPAGITAKDAALLHLLGLGVAATMPAPTLEDAKRRYIKEKVEGTHNEQDKIQRVERVIGHVEATLGRRDIGLSDIRKTDAIDIRDHMLDVIKSPATVKRYLNDLRAIFQFGLDLFDLTKAVSNPFHNLTVKMSTVAKDDRDPFTEDQLKRTRRWILGHAGEDLQRIWRLLEGTGCRLGEVTGLLVSDVRLDHKFPHISLVFHPHRRLKTKGSVRSVPLIGDALKAAQEAVEAAQGQDLLFPAYGRVGGSDAASAALMKNVRKIVADKKVTVHSLRHSMTDRIRLSGASTAEEYLILGRSTGAVGEAYGGDEARLEVATKAMQKAMVAER
ncbi:tyrosine-type recombinase/integrase [Mesorhizobium sp. M0146]|uniref:tyrosine-type recombinase/integrase n=1 Tax=unclassified Mesorhizobium TaxID=325217 RepID=UPI003338D48B